LKCVATVPGSEPWNAYAVFVALCPLGLSSTGLMRMPAKFFFDSNILIYAVAQNDPRSVTAEELLNKGGVVSVQSLNEFAAVGRRKLAMSWNEINEFREAILILCPNPIPISLDTHKSAVVIAEEYRYSIYDALITAAALEAGCTTLYSEDLQDGQVIDRQLTIRNPFR
jgi:predicted nucleic acid-binding protein